MPARNKLDSVLDEMDEEFGGLDEEFAAMDDGIDRLEIVRDAQNRIVGLAKGGHVVKRVVREGGRAVRIETVN